MRYRLPVRLRDSRCVTADTRGGVRRDCVPSIAHRHRRTARNPGGSETRDNGRGRASRLRRVPRRTIGRGPAAHGRGRGRPYFAPPVLCLLPCYPSYPYRCCHVQIHADAPRRLLSPNSSPTALRTPSSLSSPSWQRRILFNPSMCVCALLQPIGHSSLTRLRRMHFIKRTTLYCISTPIC